MQFDFGFLLMLSSYFALPRVRLGTRYWKNASFKTTYCTTATVQTSEAHLLLRCCFGGDVAIAAFAAAALLMMFC